MKAIDSLHKSMKYNKVLIITNIPNPSRIALFNQIKKKLNAFSCEFKVIFGSSGYERRKWDIDLKDCKFDKQILNSNKIKLGNIEKVMFTYKGLLGIVNSE